MRLKTRKVYLWVSKLRKMCPTEQPFDGGLRRGKKKITKIPESFSTPNFRIHSVQSVSLCHFSSACYPGHCNTSRKMASDVYCSEGHVASLRLGTYVSSRGVICWQAQRRLSQAEIQWQQLKVYLTKPTLPSMAKPKTPIYRATTTDKWFGKSSVPKMRFRCYFLNAHSHPKSIPLF